METSKTMKRETKRQKKSRKVRHTNRQESAKHQQCAIMSNLVQENNKTKQKHTAKNKASREIHT